MYLIQISGVSRNYNTTSRMRQHSSLAAVEEARLTDLYTTRPKPLVPTLPTTFFAFQHNTPQHISSDTLSTIEPSAMKRIGIGYGGLKGFAYIESVQEFTEGAKNDPDVAEVIRERCDHVSKGAFGFEAALRQLLDHKGMQIVSETNEPLVLADLDACSDAVVVQNNEAIIRYLSELRRGRVSEPLSETESCWLQRLGTQIQVLASRRNDHSLVSRIRQDKQ